MSRSIQREHRPWTEIEILGLRQIYKSATTNHSLRLAEFARSIDRGEENVCRKARELGLTNPRRGIGRASRQRSFLSIEPSFKAAEMSSTIRQHFAKEGHPRGMLGKKHTAEARSTMGDGSRRAWADPNHRFNSAEYRQAMSDRSTEMQRTGKLLRGGVSSYSRAKSGRRPDLDGLYVRSKWEANYARVLNYLKRIGQISDWQYEPKVFEFVAIKRGNRSYTPDFLLTRPDGTHEWHEVKGWMDDNSRVRIERFRKFFPEEKLVIIDATWFKRNNRTYRGLPGWE